MSSPFESPQTVGKQKSKTHCRFDAGLWAGRYLLFWGFVSFMGGVYNMMNDGRVDMFVAPVALLFCAWHLIRHESAARVVVLSACVICLTLFGLIPFLVLFTVSSIGMFLGALSFAALGIMVFAVPLWLLLTPESHLEFNQGRESEVKNK